MNEELTDIYNHLKTLLKKYEGDLKPRFDLDSRYELWSIKDVEINGRKRKEVYFAGLIIQSSYVGFYYMPMYTDTDLIEVFPQELLKLKKGKSCFHIKKLDSKMENHISHALEVGYRLYKRRGWI